MIKNATRLLKTSYMSSFQSKKTLLKHHRNIFSTIHINHSGHNLSITFVDKVAQKWSKYCNIHWNCIKHYVTYMQLQAETAINDDIDIFFKRNCQADEKLFDSIQNLAVMLCLMNCL